MTARLDRYVAMNEFLEVKYPPPQLASRASFPHLSLCGSFLFVQTPNEVHQDLIFAGVDRP